MRNVWLRYNERHYHWRQEPRDQNFRRIFNLDKLEIGTAKKGVH
jgi:hypothetical protein